MSQRDEASRFKEAIEYAKIAAEFPSGDRERKLYALNQYLYYQCLYQRLAVKPLLKWETIGDVAQRLQQSKNSRDWQYRYDDTLSYYYEGEAEREKSSSHRKNWYDLALASVNRAVDESHGDPEPIDHLERLMLSMRNLKSTVRKAAR